jgi:hypothetical protein
MMASELERQETSFEPSDISPRGTLIAAIAVLVGMWIIVALLYFFFAFLVHQPTAVAPRPVPIQAHGNILPPYPRLQSAPAHDLKAFRAREDWELNHYYWIEQKKGTVAIPIERAIDILAAHGIPPQQKPPNLVLSQPEAGTRQTGFEGKVEPEPR